MALLVVAAAVAISGPAGTPTAGAGPAVPDCTVKIRWITARNGQLLPVPQTPGTGVSSSAYGGSAADNWTVVTNDDCSVEVVDPDPGPVLAIVDQAAEIIWGPDNTPDPCSTAVASAYSFWGHKAYSEFHWSYGTQNEPRAVSGKALADIIQGGTNMADGRNDCGMTTVPRTSFHAYLGPTLDTPDVNPNGCPASGDSSSVVGWGWLDGPAVARVCRWFSTDRSPWRLTEADMMFDFERQWVTGDPIACLPGVNEGLDLEGVATHEWGHVFGLSHVPESGNTWTQTMSEATGTCDSQDRTLGRGDLNGMIALYGGL